MFISKIVSSIIKTFAHYVQITTIKNTVISVVRVSLYRNAIYLMIANVVNTIAGFVFWIIVARFYTPEDIGLASAAISGVMLIANLSHLGIGVSLIRFLPKSPNPNSLINTSFTVNVLFSLFVSFLFLIGLDIWSPNLTFILQEPLYLISFVLFTVAYTLTTSIEAVFIANRRSGFIVIKNLVLNLLRMILPIILTGFLSFGVFGSWGIAGWLAFIVSLLFFLSKAQTGYKYFLNCNIGIIKEFFEYSFLNYISMILRVMPTYILPLMVTNILGAEVNGYFYIAWTIGSQLFMISAATSRSLLAEGSHNEAELLANLSRSVKFLLLIMVPIIVIMAIFADKILLLFGNVYSEYSTNLLRIAALSSFPTSINAVYLTIKRVQMELKSVIILTGFTCVATLGISYFYLPSLGINGVGYAWLISQGVVALGIIVSLVWKKSKKALK